MVFLRGSFFRLLENGMTFEFKTRHINTSSDAAPAGYFSRSLSYDADLISDPVNETQHSQHKLTKRELVAIFSNPCPRVSDGRTPKKLLR